MTKWVCEDTGTLLMDTQIKYSYDYGGEKVIFDKDEVTAIKTIDKKGLRLMGFKPRSALKTYFNLRHSSFIYPDEQVNSANFALFSFKLFYLLSLYFFICYDSIFKVARLHLLPCWTACWHWTKWPSHDGPLETTPHPEWSHFFLKPNRLTMKAYKSILRDSM